MNNKNLPRILVAMSGGIDSSVTAALLKNQGYEVIGLHFVLWGAPGPSLVPSGAMVGCGGVNPVDVQALCKKLDIVYHCVDLRDVFSDKVLDHYVHECLQQRRTHPCIQCNQEVKFRFLIEKANELACQYIATGHYARVVQDPGHNVVRLYRAHDEQMDQSYSLFGLDQATLKRTVMPLGALPKTMVMKLAGQFGLDRKDRRSEICFCSAESIIDLVEKRTAAVLRPKGILRSLEGHAVGDHGGMYQFVVGQSEGLHLHSHPDHAYHVIGFEPLHQAVIVGPESRLMHREALASGARWIRPMDGLHGVTCQVRLQPNKKAVPCRLTLFENNSVLIQFEESQRAMMCGHAAVFYDDEEVLGGAFLERVGPS